MMRKMIEKHRRAMLVSAIVVIVAVILLLIPEGPPPPPKPGPLFDYVQKLETITINLPGSMAIALL